MPLPSLQFLPLGENLATSIRKQLLNSSTLKVARHCNVYTCGDQDGKVYLVEHGQVKTLVLSKSGKECLLSIYTAGDIFGELCLLGTERTETATAMKATVLRQVSGSKFLAGLSQDGLLEDFIKYLVARLSEQQQIITNLVTVDSEHRLAATLLRLARKLGKKDPRSLRIEEKISHEELSEMVGTTRSRIGHFMKRFRDLGLVEMTPESFLIIKEQRLSDYIEASLQSLRAKPTEE